MPWCRKPTSACCEMHGAFAELQQASAGFPTPLSSVERNSVTVSDAFAHTAVSDKFGEEASCSCLVPCCLDCLPILCGDGWGLQGCWPAGQISDCLGMDFAGITCDTPSAGPDSACCLPFQGLSSGPEWMSLACMGIGEGSGGA